MAGRDTKNVVPGKLISSDIDLIEFCDSALAWAEKPSKISTASPV